MKPINVKARGARAAEEAARLAGKARTQRLILSLCSEAETGERPEVIRVYLSELGKRDALGRVPLRVRRIVLWDEAGVGHGERSSAASSADTRGPVTDP
ncbi:MAG: hypothetical protein ACE5JS_22440, partial [Nitrospinota bacterium]